MRAHWPRPRFKNSRGIGAERQIVAEQCFPYFHEGRMLHEALKDLAPVEQTADRTLPGGEIAGGQALDQWCVRARQQNLTRLSRFARRDQIRQDRVAVSVG